MALHDARRGDAPAYDRARFGDGLKGCCALHKRDNHPRRDQGVYASKGDAEIQTAHDVLILELVLFAGYCSFQMLFCLPCKTSRGRRGYVPAGKYKSELKGKVFHREHTTALATEYFSSVPVGDRTDEVSVQRFGQPWPGCPPPRAVAMGKKARPLVSLHGRVFA